MIPRQVKSMERTPDRSVHISRPTGFRSSLELFKSLEKPHPATAPTEKVNNGWRKTPTEGSLNREGSWRLGAKEGREAPVVIPRRDRELPSLEHVKGCLPSKKNGYPLYIDNLHPDVTEAYTLLSQQNYQIVCNHCSNYSLDV